MNALRPIALVACLALALAGCAAPPAMQTGQALELTDLKSRSTEGVTVSVAILTDAQAHQHFGVDLGRHELQALWLSVRNDTDNRLWFLRTILDPDHYSAEEAAQLLEGDLPKNARAGLHQYLRDESVRTLMIPRAITEGFVFLPRIEGGRYVDIRLQTAATPDAASRDGRTSIGARELRFDFALPLPDGDFDYERLDPARTYAGRTLPSLTVEELRATLEQLPCCAANSDGHPGGDPLNIVLIGDASDVMNSLTRSGWSFTHRISLRTVGREIGAAIDGGPYAVAPVSSLYLFDRKQDVALQRARRSISQRNHMRLWMAPFQFEGRNVWIGQVSRDIGVKVTPRSPTLTTHVIDPEVDTTRQYLMHSLVARGFVDRFGFVKGSAYAARTEPRYNLTNDPYHSDGMRLVVVLAREPITVDRIRSLEWEQDAPAIAEGQSDRAQRHVRPIEPATDSPVR
jgi:hypothetical protein